MGGNGGHNLTTWVVGRFHTVSSHKGKSWVSKATMSLRVLCHDTILLKMLIIKGAMLFFTNEFATKPQLLSWL